MRHYLAVLAVLACFALACAEELKVVKLKDIKIAQKKCAPHTKADVIAKYDKLDFSDDEDTRCYLLCMSEHFGFFNDREGFLPERWYVQLTGSPKSRDALKAEFAECFDKNEQKTDNCTWAFRGTMCIMDKNGEVIRKSIE